MLLIRVRYSRSVSLWSSWRLRIHLRNRPKWPKSTVAIGFSESSRPFSRNNWMRTPAAGSPNAGTFPRSSTSAAAKTSWIKIIVKSWWSTWSCWRARSTSRTSSKSWMRSTCSEKLKGTRERRWKSTAEKAQRERRIARCAKFNRSIIHRLKARVKLRKVRVRSQWRIRIPVRP